VVPRRSGEESLPLPDGAVSKDAAIVPHRVAVAAGAPSTAAQGTAGREGRAKPVGTLTDT
jgi:hypothetical protein